MSKITNMIISAVLKKGLLYEGRNVDITIDIPNKEKPHVNFIKAEDTKKYYQLGATSINIKAEHMTIRLVKESNKNE